MQSLEKSLCEAPRPQAAPRVAPLRIPFDLSVTKDETPASPREFHLTRAQPVGLILGMTGTGKSVLALHLANQALMHSVPHVCVLLPADVVDRDAMKASPMLLAPHVFKQLRNAHGSRIDARAVRPTEDLREVCADLPAGALVIADEIPLMIRSPEVVRDWIDWVHAEGRFMLLSSQTVGDLFDGSDPVANRRAFLRIGLVFSGRHHRQYVLPENTPKLVGVAVRGAETLAYPPRGKREFFVSALSLPCGGLIAAPLFSMYGTER